MDKIAKSLKDNAEATLAAIKREDLEKFLEAANDAYYNKGKPLVTDALYDLAQDRLRELDADSKVLREVGAPITDRKVELPYYMGSLDKIRDDDDTLKRWADKYPGKIVISDKLDGNSALFVQGKLYSRGDGTTGQNISHLIPHIRGLPKSANAPAARGELIISKADWETIKDAGANARNVVAGVMHSKKPAARIVNVVQFVAYEIMDQALAPSDGLKALAKAGYTVVHSEPHDADALTTENLSKILMRRRKETAYEIDGIVVYHDTLYARVSGKNPKNAFAFKTIATHDEVEVTVTRIEWNVSKDGYLKPIVHFPQIALNGVNIKQASGFNAAYIRDNKLGPGARIAIIRSGDVIPHIAHVIEQAEAPSMPSIPFKWNETNVDAMVTDDNNGDIQLKRMEHFAKKLNIEHLAIGTLRKLRDAGYTTVKDLFELDVDTVAEIPGFQKKSAERLIASLQASRASWTLVGLMTASNIFGRNLGSTKLAAIAAAIPSIATGTIPKIEQVSAVSGIGPVGAKAFVEALPEFNEFAAEIGFVPPIMAAPASSSTGPAPPRGKYAGKIVAFSGFRDKDLEARVTALGGRVGSSVSSKTDYLVVKELNEDSSKIREANEKGIPIILRDEFTANL